MTPGQAAYEIGRALYRWEMVSGPWESLPEHLQAIWEQIAATAIEVHRGLNACSCKRPTILVHDEVITPGQSLYIQTMYMASKGGSWELLSAAERGIWETRAQILRKP